MAVPDPKEARVPDPAVARLAVLIDADNTSASHAGALLEEVARYGVPTVKRAYGDWTTQQLVGWKKALNENAIQPVQQFAYTQGKNSTDSALIIDAMDLLYSGNLDAFALVSSDSDFTRLATRLRESGKTVYGLGRRRTPPSLVAACDKFIYLEVLGQQDADGAQDSASEDESGEGSAPLPDLRKLLTSAIDATSAEDGWAHLGSVGSYLGTRHASFDPRNYGFAKLISLARAQDYVEVEQTDDNATRVRLTGGKGPAAKATKATTAKKTAAAKAPAKKSSSRGRGRGSGQSNG
ncbi:MAG: NYN domain-containing protein [Actinobacteria bacterium]|jgi:uncharacterized LabA/DUF88 family protein|nr:NYN domain-containing protein [Actinomycetota bacterium]